jgi:exosortase family protein XrtM
MATTPARFALKFVIGFAVLMSAFEASRGTAFERFVIEDVILLPTVKLINTVTPTEQVSLEGRSLVSAGATLHVTRGCEGVEMFLLLIAAILAFPASFKRRVQGLLFGSILAYGLSIARLMALHYILRYSPSTWETSHGLILPLAPIFLMALFFLRWSSADLAPNARDQDSHAA